MQSGTPSPTDDTRAPRAGEPSKDELVAKYSAWIVEVEGRARTLERSRPAYQRLFVAVFLLSGAGYFWNAWVGAGSVFSGLLFCVFGFYALAIRARDYRHELAHARATVRGLLDADASAGARAPSSPVDRAR